ncbi:MAG: hypothetical protein RLZZ350_148 [Verrucomicrobiota bacterium]
MLIVWPLDDHTSPADNASVPPIRTMRRLFSFHWLLALLVLLSMCSLPGYASVIISWPPFVWYDATNVVPIPPGFSLIANSVDAEDSRLAVVLPHPPLGTTFSKLDPRTQKLTANVFGLRGWSNPNETLNPGEGALVFNPSRRTVNAEFRYASWLSTQRAVSVPVGLSLVSIGCDFGSAPSDSVSVGDFAVIRHLPGIRIIGVENLGTFFNPHDGDTVWTLNRQTQRLEKHIYRNATGWDSVPVVGANEAFFVQTAQTRAIEPWFRVTTELTASPFFFPDDSFGPPFNIPLDGSGRSR